MEIILFYSLRGTPHINLKIILRFYSANITNFAGVMFKRSLFIISGLTCVGLGAIGVVVPGLPTTPFMLLASWLFYRSSPALQKWLRASYFGRYIRDYERDHGMTRKAKAFAISMMMGMSLISTIFFIKILWVKIVVLSAALIGMTVVSFVVPTVVRTKS